ncbi:MAG: hypothetical protein HY812_15170 [Planctomycetes bacterium]|nr:hypothetical protein [Planctomycetota bacterium]
MMPLLFLPLVLPLFLPVPRQEQAQADGACIIRLERRDFTEEVSCEGAFVPWEADEIALWPEAFRGELVLVDVRPSGSYVNEGDAIARLDTSAVDREIHAAELEVRWAETALMSAEARLEADEGAAREVAEIAAAALERARRELLGWQERELSLRARELDLRDLYTQHSIEDQEAELAELESMYREDELTDATEELVLKRSRRNLAATYTSRDLAQERRAFEDAYEIVTQTELKEESVRQHEGALARLLRTQEGEARAREDAVLAAEEELARKREQLERLVADREAFEVRAPRAGLLVHGAPAHYEPGAVAPRHAAGQSLPPRQTLFTVLEPDRCALVVNVPEGKLSSVRDGMAVKVVPAAAPGTTLLGNLRLERCPQPDSAQAAENRFKGTVAFEAPAYGMVPGMRAGAAIVTETRTAAFVLPRSALLGEGASLHCLAAGEDGEFRRVDLAPGPGTDAEIVVTGELAEGMRVLVPRPEAAGR